MQCLGFIIFLFQVGHNAGDEFTFHWWDHMFKKAIDNIDVQNDEVYSIIHLLHFRFYRFMIYIFIVVLQTDNSTNVVLYLCVLLKTL